nr:DUF2807 domain-containing protein [uncultured Allomuricauda sp.]
MKKSNLILLGALGIALFFSLVFQIVVHSNIKKAKANEIPVEVITETRVVAPFDAINASNRLRIVFLQSDESKVIVNAPNYIIDSIGTTVVNRKLIIEASKKLKKKDTIVIQINAPLLTSLELNNKVHFEADTPITGENLHLEFNDESSGAFNLSYDFVSYINNTDGAVTLKGEIEKIDHISNTKQ